MSQVPRQQAQPCSQAGGAEVRPMAAEDMPAVCELIGAAFADNPSTLANVRGDRVRARRVMREAVRVAKFGRPWSSALVAVQEGKIVGALNAAPWPHCQLGIAQKMQTAPSMIRIWQTALPRAFTMMSKREAHDPAQAHWHIGPIGVRPDRQGYGIGTALLAEFLSTVDQQNLPAFLETDVDRNVILYQKFGFNVTRREQIVGIDTRFMWRDARPPADRPGAPGPNVPVSLRIRAADKLSGQRGNLDAHNRPHKKDSARPVGSYGGNPPGAREGKQMFSRLVRLAIGRPRRVIIAAVIVALFALVIGGALSADLTSGLQDYDDPASPTVAAENAVLRATGIDPEEGFLLLVRTSAPLTEGSAPPAIVRDAESVLRSQPEVKQVLDYQTAGDPGMISRDGMSTYLVGELGEVNEKDATVALQHSINADPLLRANTWLGGPTVANVQVSSVSTADLGYAEAVAFPILLLALLFVFRSVVAAALPLIGSVYAIALTLLGMGAVMTVTKLSVFALNLVLALGLGLSIDFSLLMISRYREELARGATVTQAVTTMLTVTGRTILFSSLTVASALAVLVIFPQRFLYSMGIAGVLTTLAAASYALLVLPAVLAVLGTRINKGAPKRLSRPRPAVDERRGRWYRFAIWVMRRRFVTAFAAAGLLIVLALPFTGIKFTGVDSSVLGNGSSAGQVYNRLSQDFDHADLAPVGMIVDAPASAGPALTRYAAKLGAVPGVADVTPPQQLAAGLWEVDVALDNAPLSAAAQSTLRQIETVPVGFTATPTGQTAEFRALQNSLGSHLPIAIGLIALTTLLLLFAMTGSVILPLKALVMNALSLGAAFGILVMIFQWGNLQSLLGFTSQGALESTSPIVMFALAFGLSTDYGVFLLARIKEGHVRGLPTDEAVAAGLERTGPIVTAAASLLFVAVGALALSSLIFIKELGVGAAVAVFLDATIVRAVLVPALMAILGRGNWWAPPFLRRLRSTLRLDGIEKTEPAGGQARAGMAAPDASAGAGSAEIATSKPGPR